MSRYGKFHMKIQTHQLRRYCDPAAPYEERQNHLARYGFHCSCSLCEADEADGTGNRKERLNIWNSLEHPQRFSHSDRITMVSKLEQTYRSDRRVSKPEMYRALRQAADTLRSKQPNKAFELELRIFEALGAELASGLTDAGTLPATVFLHDPFIMVQDTINLCFDIAYRCHQKRDNGRRR